MTCDFRSHVIRSRLSVTHTISMKNYILPILLALTSCSVGKIALEKEYQKAITSIDPSFNEAIQLYNGEFFESEGNGAAVFLKAKIDTIGLNNDFKNWEYSELDKSEQAVWIASGTLDSTILRIGLGEIWGNQFINYEVKKGKVASEFREYYKDDNLIKLNPKDAPINEAAIPLLVDEIALSKLENFEVGEIIYGKIKMITRPYYLQELGSDFDFEYIQRKYICYFKFKVK